jgi:Ser/Thr protein kinase RdoA (MazF antagonist)
LISKAKAFIKAYHAARPLDLKVIEDWLRLARLEAAVAERPASYIRNLTRHDR